MGYAYLMYDIACSVMVFSELFGTSQPDFQRRRYVFELGKVCEEGRKGFFINFTRMNMHLDTDIRASACRNLLNLPRSITN